MPKRMLKSENLEGNSRKIFTSDNGKLLKAFVQ